MARLLNCFQHPATRYFAGGIIGALLGLDCAVAIVSNWLSADFAILVSIIETLVTVAMGLFIALVFERAIRASDREKDFLMRELDTLVSHVSDLGELDDGRPLTEVTALIKSMNTTAARIGTLVSKLNRHNLQRAIFEFADDIKELRRLATDTPIRQVKEYAHKRSRCSAEVKDGIITLAKDRENELRLQLSKVRNRILDAQIAVMAS